MFSEKNTVATPSKLSKDLQRDKWNLSIHKDRSLTNSLNLIIREGSCNSSVTLIILMFSVYDMKGY